MPFKLGRRTPAKQYLFAPHQMGQLELYTLAQTNKSSAPTVTNEDAYIARATMQKRLYNLSIRSLWGFAAAFVRERARLDVVQN
jgi:hypothetical protein